MNVHRWQAVAALAFAAFASLAACGGGGGAGAAGGAALPAFRAEITHRYFPLAAGAVWTYEGEEDGAARRDTVRVAAEPRVLLGVVCTGLSQDVLLDGVRTERTDEWYAEDVDGNVWQFGEESYESAGAEFVRTSDSWIAGEGDARPFIAMPAVPRVGDTMVGGPPGDESRTEVAAVTDTVEVPAGTFTDCLRLVENPDDPEDTDIILYADGTGLVSETFAGGRLDLVAVETR